MMNATISLANFEALDEAFNYWRQSVETRLEARAESRLFGVLVDVFGFAAANEINNVVEYAAEVLTDCLIGKTEVIDVEA